MSSEAISEHLINYVSLHPHTHLSSKATRHRPTSDTSLVLYRSFSCSHAQMNNLHTFSKHSTACAKLYLLQVLCTTEWTTMENTFYKLYYHKTHCVRPQYSSLVYLFLVPRPNLPCVLCGFFGNNACEQFSVGK